MTLPRSALPSLVAGALALLAAACDDKQAAPGPASQAGPPPTVLVVRAAAQPVTQGAEFIGRVEALERVEIRARVTGYLRERRFEEGQLVQAGQPLFLIEQEPFRAELRQREAQLERARAELNNATLQANRGKELLRTNAIPAATVDQRVADQQTAAAALAAREADVASAKITLGYTEIDSPIAGRVGRASVTPGNVVSPSSGVLTVVVREDPMKVLFPVTQRQLLTFRREAASQSMDALRVKLRLPDGSIYEQTGKLNFVDVQTDRSTDSVTVQAVVPNPNAILSDGQFVGVIVEDQAPRQAIVIPQSAIQIDQAGAFVLVVGAENKVELKRVKISRGPSGQQVVDEGLAPGALVITEGAQRARPGGVVNPRPMDAPPTGAPLGPTPARAG